MIIMGVIYTKRIPWHTLPWYDGVSNYKKRVLIIRDTHRCVSGKMMYVPCLIPSTSELTPRGSNVQPPTCQP